MDNIRIAIVIALLVFVAAQGTKMYLHAQQLEAKGTR
jgi:hypothetical protein